MSGQAMQMSSACRWTTCLAACFFLIHLPHAIQGSWVNDYDKPVSFTCPANQFISVIASVHHNGPEDRIWNFHCRYLPVRGSVTKHTWTGLLSKGTSCIRTLYYVNNFDEPVAYVCPEGFITGMRSIHNNGKEDRRFKFQCGRVQGTVVHGCQFSGYGYENNFDQPLHFIVPHGKVLTGVFSYHRNDVEDRRFKYMVCNIRKLKTSDDCHDGPKQH